VLELSFSDEEPTIDRPASFLTFRIVTDFVAVFVMPPEVKLAPTTTDWFEDTAPAALWSRRADDASPGFRIRRVPAVPVAEAEEALVLALAAHGGRDARRPGQPGLAA